MSRAVWPFWNAEERRPRALVRLTLYVALIALVMVASGFVASFFGRGVGAMGVFFGVQALGALGVTMLCARAIDRRPLASVGIAPRRGYLLDVGFGIALGGVCMGAIALLESAIGWAEFEPRHLDAAALEGALPSFGSSITVFAAVALIEELTFRGYALPNLREMLPARIPPDQAITIAVVLSSAAFGVAHAGNPNASPIATAYIAFGGLFLAIGLVVQGDLAIPIGAHFGWNFFQNLLGMQVSGQTWLEEGAILRREELGPDVATGGAFGPEAGLEGLGAMVLGIALTLGWLRLRGGPLRVHPSFVSASLVTPGGRRGRMAP